MNTEKPARWFRMYAEFATDPKVQMLSETLQRRFLMLLCLRCSNGNETLHETEIAFQLRISGEELAQTKIAFLEKNLIQEDWKPTAWNKRQYASDSSTERVSKYRAKHATPKKRKRNVSVTSPETETETEKEVVKALSGKPDLPAKAKNGKANHRVEAADVLAFLNEKAGRAYRPVPANLDLIAARLSDGATPDELRAVIERKCGQWATDEKMAEFLRPATLFNRTKFAQYQGEIGSFGQPIRCDA